MNLRDEFMSYLKAGRDVEEILETITDTLVEAAEEYEKERHEVLRLAYAEAVNAAITDYLAAVYPDHNFNPVDAKTVADTIDEIIAKLDTPDTCTIPLRVEAKVEKDSDAVIRDFLTELGL